GQLPAESGPATVWIRAQSPSFVHCGGIAKAIAELLVEQTSFYSLSQERLQSQIKVVVLARRQDILQPEQEALRVNQFRTELVGNAQIIVRDIDAELIRKLSHRDHEIAKPRLSLWCSPML